MLHEIQAVRRDGEHRAEIEPSDPVLIEPVQALQVFRGDLPLEGSPAQRDAVL
jgi:uncharacterized heparinase superfamily protein